MNTQMSREELLAKMRSMSAEERRAYISSNKQGSTQVQKPEPVPQKVGEVTQTLKKKDLPAPEQMGNTKPLLRNKDPLRAIANWCLQCSGNSREEREGCVIKHCPLYPFREGVNPFSEDS